MFDSIQEVLRIGVPFVLSGMTAYMMYLLKQKDRRGWYVSLGNQGLWLWFAITTASWGLLPLNFWLTYVAVKGIREWQANPK